jgi:hypothetical protein
MSQEKKNDFTIEINGKEFQLQKEVFDLILITSKERDLYRGVIETLQENKCIKDDYELGKLTRNLLRFN